MKIIPEAYLFVDLSGSLRLINEKAYQYYSLPKDRALGQSFWEFFPDDYFGFSMRESLQMGISHRLIYKSHRFLELEITTSFIFEEIGGLAIVAKEIGQWRRMQELLARGEKMQKLGEMVAQVAHEIRNPLGAVRGFATILENDLQKFPELQEMAAFIIEGTRRLEELVGNLLHYARPITVKLQTKEMGKILKEIAKFVKMDPAFPESVRIELHIPNHSILAPLDGEMLKSALLNLIFNAVHAMPDGGILTISLFEQVGGLQIAIGDTGIGMDEEIRQHLFSPNFTTKKQGNGLGLIEAEKIIKAHLGTIDVRSQKGIGTTFTITIPLKR